MHTMFPLKNTAVAMLVVAGALIGAARAAAPEAIVTPLMTKPLDDYPGKEALMITVEYPPGSVDPVHRHYAHAFVYVLEGSIVMQVKGGKEVTLTPGQTFYEGPNDVHTVGRNASQTQPAKFIVLLLKDKGAPVLVPEK
jgi:quercetin dioxygenase-like cupin family protein